MAESQAPRRMVIDGTGTKAFRADVAVSGGKVAASVILRAYKPRAHSIAPGRSSRPGFIDIHSHSDFLVPGRDHGTLLEPFVRQGMTTLVGVTAGSARAGHGAHERSIIERAG